MEVLRLKFRILYTPSYDMIFFSPQKLLIIILIIEYSIKFMIKKWYKYCNFKPIYRQFINNHITLLSLLSTKSGDF